MSMFSLPGWIKPHLYPGKKFDDLSVSQMEYLKQKLTNFKSDNPDVSVVIPAWNEENNIFRTLSCLAANRTNLEVEIVVVNNNSKDRTQILLDKLGVRTYLQPQQGTPYARQMGLEKAKGRFHLCADSDTFYPPSWIELMTTPMINDPKLVGVYGRYAYLPPEKSGRIGLWVYEKITGILIRVRKKNREHLNTLGFNMGFITEVGRMTGGFKVNEVRMFDNAANSEHYTEVAEDGQMALNLKTAGKLKMVTNPGALVFTSPRRLLQDGSVSKAFWNRVKLHGGRMKEYFTGKYKQQ